MFFGLRLHSANNREAIAPVKLAIFDFELEDFSGAAGIIPESGEDLEQLRRATETARWLLIDWPPA